MPPPPPIWPPSSYAMRSTWREDARTQGRGGRSLETGDELSMWRSGEIDNLVEHELKLAQVDARELGRVLDAARTLEHVLGALQHLRRRARRGDA